MTNRNPSQELGPFPLDQDERWRWRTTGYVVDGAFWPFALEVRFKGAPCHHDSADVADLPAYMEWEPTPCNCWDGLAEGPPVEALPPGGLSARMLRGIRTSRADESLQAMARLLDEHGISRAVGLPGAAALNKAMTEALTAPPPSQRFTTSQAGKTRGRGRPAMSAATHLKRLAACQAAQDRGRNRSEAARELGLKAATLRSSLEWGRQRGYWMRYGRGRAGGLTESGRAALVDVPSPRGT